MINKKLKPLLVIVFILALGANLQSQHLSSLIDFDGDDFGFNITSLIGHEDSIYFTTEYGGDNNLGALIKMTEDGEGQEVIFSFDQTSTRPFHLIANDTALFGTTYESQNGRGKLFKYSFQNYSFEYLHEFTFDEAGGVKLIKLTDSVIWAISNESSIDLGSIFTIGYDGSNFTKVYSNTSSELGQNPIDLEVVGNELFIAFYNGGGIPYDNGGGLTSSGSISKVNLDGSNFQNIIQGQDQVGTQPYDLLYFNEKLYGAFTSAGSDVNGRLFKINLDGSEYVEIASYENLGYVGRGSIYNIDGSLYASTSSTLLHIVEGDTIVKMVELDDNTGRDMAIGAIPYNGAWYMPTRQGGTGGSGGGLIKWMNHEPTISGELPDLILHIGDAGFELNLDTIFSDIDGDELYFNASSGTAEIVNLQLEGSFLSLDQLASGETVITLSAEDFYGGYLEIQFSVIVNQPPTLQNEIQDTVITAGFEPYLIDLDLFFQDFDNNGQSLNYSVSTATSEVIETTINENFLSIGYLSFGSETITIIAEDLYGATVETTFEIIVNSQPTLVTEIPDTVIISGVGEFSLNLDLYFEDLDDSELTYEVTTDSNVFEETSISENTLSIIGSGQGQIIVTAIDSYGIKISDEFQVDIRIILKSNWDNVTTYPNPASDIIMLNSNKFRSFEFINLNGTIVKEGLVSANLILVGDMTKGEYILKLYSDNQVTSKKIYIK